jgi:hypothetical protein
LEERRTSAAIGVPSKVNAANDWNQNKTASTTSLSRISSAAASTTIVRIPVANVMITPPSSNPSSQSLDPRSDISSQNTEITQADASPPNSQEPCSTQGKRFPFSACGTNYLFNIGVSNYE